MIGTVGPEVRVSDKKHIKIPAWLSNLGLHLVQAAETAFKVPHSGAAKKAWVENALKTALKGAASLDPIPDWVETPAIDVIVSTLVDVIWGLAIGGSTSGDADANDEVKAVVQHLTLG